MDECSALGGGALPRSIDRPALVLVHPGAAARGPSVQIRAQCALIRASPGSLFILDDGKPFPLTPNAAQLREVLGDAVEGREHASLRCRIAAPERGLLAAVSRVLELAAARRGFLLTGAGMVIATTGRLLEAAGARAHVHPSAVTYDTA
jgi:hypothetical protein